MLTHPTTHYAELVKAMDGLRPLVRGVNPLSCDTPLQELKVKGYVLLSHAVIEEYLENLTLSAAKQAVEVFKSKKTVTIALLGLVSSSLLDEISLGKAKKKINQEVFNNTDVFAGEALTKFHLVVRGNNGIKKSNQISLFVPVGVDPEAIDAATMAAMDAYGTKRGDLAHKAKITKVHTLSEVSGDINNILLGLKAFDQAICSAL